MNIRYVGQSTVRIIGPYIWNKKNEYIQDVEEPELIANLLTYPTPDFALANEEDREEAEAIIEQVLGTAPKKTNKRKEK